MCWGRVSHLKSKVEPVRSPKVGCHWGNSSGTPSSAHSRQSLGILKMTLSQSWKLYALRGLHSYPPAPVGTETRGNLPGTQTKASSSLLCNSM